MGGRERGRERVRGLVLTVNSFFEFEHLVAIIIIIKCREVEHKFFQIKGIKVAYSSSLSYLLWISDYISTFILAPQLYYICPVSLTPSLGLAILFYNNGLHISYWDTRNNVNFSITRDPNDNDYYSWLIADAELNSCLWFLQDKCSVKIYFQVHDWSIKNQVWNHISSMHSE